jgi:hypothetical protein
LGILGQHPQRIGQGRERHSCPAMRKNIISGAAGEPLWMRKSSSAISEGSIKGINAA